MIIKVMKRIFLCLAAATVLCSLSCNGQRNLRRTPHGATINAMFDLSHQFAFYTDGRFASQYLKGQNTSMNWGNFYDIDFSNVNLLVLLGCDDRSPYSGKDREAIRKYADSNGGLVVLGDPGGKSQGSIAEMFGVEFEGTTSAALTSLRFAPGPVQSQGNATTLKLADPSKWTVLVSDKDNKPVLVMSNTGSKNVVIGSRSIAGSNPDAHDSINVAMWKPLLLDIASHKTVDVSKTTGAKGWNDLGHDETKNGLEISYTDYLAPYADAMFDITARIMPYMEKRMGVPLSGNMGSKIMLLATGGGGFSSGEMIALAVWWGGFPDKEDSMIEFITHESVHSWVLPFAEIWNEPIATYVGNLVMMDMGYAESDKTKGIVGANERIAACIDRARKADPNFNLYDIDGHSCKEGVADLPKNQVNELHWGKSYWIWEQMRAENPDVVADYFQAKRKYATKEVVTKYDANNTVAVMSIAMGRDMFPWFRSIGFDVDREKAEVKF